MAGLLRQVGPRGAPPADVQQSVRIAVEAEWRAMVAERRQASRAWQRPLAMAAALALAIGVLWLAIPGEDARSPAVVTVARVAGTVQSSVNGGAVLAGRVLLPGESLTTGAGSRAAVALGPGVVLRLDENSTVSFTAPERLRLAAGRVYLDADPLAPPIPLELSTTFGTVRHLGTQYQAQLGTDRLRLTVREGIVELSTASGAVRAGAGEALELAADGGLRRSVVSASGIEWDWIHAVAPTIVIEQRPLAEFLRWVARETGRELRYDSGSAQAAAERLILRGSVAGLAPDQALAAVMATTSLHHELGADELRVSRGTAGD